jgi:hypothetical protein
MRRRSTTAVAVSVLALGMGSVLVPTTGMRMAGWNSTADGGRHTFDREWRDHDAGHIRYRWIWNRSFGDSIESRKHGVRLYKPVLWPLLVAQQSVLLLLSALAIRWAVRLDRTRAANPGPERTGTRA